MATFVIVLALAVLALEEQGLRPGDKEVLVTGAAGGVPSKPPARLFRAV